MSRVLKLAVFIDAAGLRQGAIAKRMGRNRAWISRVVNGTQRVFHDDMIEIAQALSLMLGRRVEIGEISGTIGVSGEQTEAAGQSIPAASQHEGGHL